jgi:hypothetical protein
MERKTQKMLTKQFNLKAIIPKKVEETISINAVENFTKKITKYSELISNSKKSLQRTASCLF